MSCSRIAASSNTVFAPGSPDASRGAGNGSPSVCAMSYLGIPQPGHGNAGVVAEGDACMARIQRARGEVFRTGSLRLFKNVGRSGSRKPPVNPAALLATDVSNQSRRHTIQARRLQLMLEFHLHEVLCIVAIRRFMRASRSSSSPGPLVDSCVHGSHRVLGRWLLQPRRPSLAQAQPTFWSVHRDDIPGSATPSRTRLEDR